MNKMEKGVENTITAYLLKIYLIPKFILELGTEGVLVEIKKAEQIVNVARESVGVDYGE